MLVKGQLEDFPQILKNQLKIISCSYKGLPDGLPYELKEYNDYVFIVKLPHIAGDLLSSLNHIISINGFVMYVLPIKNDKNEQILKLQIKPE